MRIMFASVWMTGNCIFHAHRNFCTSIEAATIISDCLSPVSAGRSEKSCDTLVAKGKSGRIINFCFIYLSLVRHKGLANILWIYTGDPNLSCSKTMSVCLYAPSHHSSAVSAKVWVRASGVRWQKKSKTTGLHLKVFQGLRRRLQPQLAVHSPCHRSRKCPITEATSWREQLLKGPAGTFYF